METLRPYQTTRVDEETGETYVDSKYLYFEGRPREYRFNGQSGQFTLYGDKVLRDSKGRNLAEFTFQPMAYRIFEDRLFGRDRSEMWAEFFFVDADDCVSIIMFNGTTVQELYKIMEPLMYERKNLTQVVLTAKIEKVTSQESNKSWYLCRFTYEEAPADLVAELKAFTDDTLVYRHDTMLGTNQNKLISDSLKPTMRAIVGELAIATATNRISIIPFEALYQNLLDDLKECDSLERINEIAQAYNFRIYTPEQRDQAHLALFAKANELELHWDTEIRAFTAPSLKDFPYPDTNGKQ